MKLKADQKVEALAKALGYKFKGSTAYPWNDNGYWAGPEEVGKDTITKNMNLFYNLARSHVASTEDRLDKIVKMLGILRKLKFTNKGDGTFMVVLNEGRWEEVYGILEELENQMVELEQDNNNNKESK